MQGHILSEVRSIIIKRVPRAGA